MSGLAVVVPLGPNPAALTELLWQLAQEGERVSRVHVVLESPEARRWWLDGGEQAYDELAGLCPTVPPRTALVLALVDEVEDQSAAFGEAVFAMLRRAQAGAEQVIVALSGGRWRGSTALTTTAFQLLARRHDALVDVRLSEPGAEGVSGFFFPGQRRQQIPGRSGHGPLLARDVRVLLDPMPTPRLRPFLEEADLGSFSQAVTASRRALEAAEPPELVFDLLAGTVLVSGQPLSLSLAHLPLYAWVAASTCADRAARSPDVAGLVAFLHEWEAAAPPEANSLTRRRSDGVVSKLLDGRLRDGQDMATPFSRAGAAVRKAVQGLPRRDLLEISHHTGHDGEVKQTRMVLALSAERIHFVGGFRPSMLDREPEA